MSLTLVTLLFFMAAFPIFSQEGEWHQNVRGRTLGNYYQSRIPEKVITEPWHLYSVQYVTPLTSRIDRVHEPGHLPWINTAWAVMEMKTGMIPEKNIERVSGALLEYWNDPKEGYDDLYGMQEWVSEQHGIEVGGDLMMARTRPPQRQQFTVRHDLMKLICMLHDFQQVLMETSSKHTRTVMPGYTHVRHAQPTTLGHYLMSVYDPVERSMKMVEDGYHAMSLNELGCGALAGTSWPLDRELVSRYLGLEGLIENTNDAVSYSDGYLLLVAGLTNIMTVVSRMGGEMEFWSGLEYDFMDFQIAAGSFMMPNKRGNQTYLENTAVGVSGIIGDLTEAASMGAKISHGDMQPMAYNMIHSVQDAMGVIWKHITPYLYHFPGMKVHKEVMLETARKGYSCASELANELVRRFGTDYRTAHEIVHHFVLASAAEGIPSKEADAGLFRVACKKVTGKALELNETELRRLLDPVHFVESTGSRGGVAPEEVERMISDRWTRLSKARARHESRISQLEKGREQMLADLKGLYEEGITDPEIQEESVREEQPRSASRVVAEMAIGTSPDQISGEAVMRARMSLLDILGNTMAGFEAPGMTEVREQFLEWGGTDQASVWFTGQSLPLPAAGFVNSAAAHAMDLDDWHRPSNTHISVVTVPAALAAGEWTGATGREILEALVIGTEVAHAIGKNYVQYRQHNKYLPTSVVGGFGATALACRLMGLSVDQTVHAFGIYYSHASGNRQALFDRTLTKRIQPAVAVRAALTAAGLAAKGFTGPENVLISEAGLYRIYGGYQGELPGLEAFQRTEGKWAIEDLAFKHFACCGASHPAIQSALQLKDENGLTLQDIESIELFGIFVGSGMVDVPWEDSENPHVLAQFCAPYEVVSAIRNGRFGPEEVSVKRIREDKEVDRLARQVVIRHQDEWGEGYPGGQTVRITTRDGRKLVASRTPLQTFDPRSWNWEMIEEKFLQNAAYSGLVTPEEAREIARRVKSMDQHPSALLEIIR